MGLDAPARRAEEVITHDAFMQALGEFEADVARKEAALARHESRDAEGGTVDLD